MYLNKDTAQGLAMFGKGTFLAVTGRLGEDLIVWPERLSGGHHRLQLLLKHIVFPAKKIKALNSSHETLDPPYNLLQPPLPPE